MKKYKNITRLLIICGALLLLVANGVLAGSAKPEGPKKDIRVAISKDKKSVKLYLKGRYSIYTLHTNELLKDGSNLKIVVYPSAGGIRLGKEDLNVFGIRIATARDASIVIDGRKFRGIMDIIREANGRLLLVNHVDIEEYLCGVLRHEVPHYWPMETLKAQAVVSRTFALYQHINNKEMDYDLTNTAFSQVYGGAAGEKRKTNKAVIETYGEVLTYKGKIFPAYFHACCGGHTQDAGRLWKNDLPVLKGRTCGYCRNTPHYPWKRKVSLWKIRGHLNDNGYKLGKILSIKAVDYDASGRIKNLKVCHSGGEAVVSAYRFRIMVSPTLIKSSKFKIKTKSDYAYFEGKGWGHGVGMCQWGALGMAMKRHKKEDILRFYYPSSEIKNIWSEDANLKLF